MTRRPARAARPIAVVGAACRFPGASSPRELWEASIAGRRAFRAIPPERLRLEDYGGEGPDSIYAVEAAVLEDWSFDRVGFRVAGSSFRAADLAHWLALEVATAALEDAGLAGDALPRETTGVLVGNSLTGEFSRAQQMRLRWPYVRRVLAAELAGEGWAPEALEAFLARLEASYKEPFPEPGEETLAGGLSNTIAGRIANHLDLRGGGYTVDGACASSLLAVANACSALAAGDLDVVLAGGVDLSLDPFELVGFSRAGALARSRMRPFDARSDGFLPGEGCGFVVLADLETARDRGLRVHGVIRGWGISSDGAGGLTRPEAAGQILALERAYRRAGFGPETVPFFEAHGTGTEVGDATELTSLSRARRDRPAGDTTAAGAAAPAAVASIKALIGHTKAAAGVAGLLRAIEAVKAGVLPPTVGCEEPHPALCAGDAGPPVLRALARAEPWPAGAPRRAGVSAMGFGGINAHVVLESPAEAALDGRPRAGERRRLPAALRRLDASRQDAELLLLSAPTAAELAERAESLAEEVERLSYAELGDLAGELALSGTVGSVRAAHRGAVVALRPRDAAERLRRLAERARDGETGIDAAGRIFLGGPAAHSRNGQGPRPPRIGFLFPGQGARVDPAGGAWVGRFEEVEALFDGAAPGPDAGVPDGPATERVQPAVARASAAALAVLDRLGIGASVAIGHSLGELSALFWAGRLEVDALLALSRARGAAMAAQRVPAAPGSGNRPDAGAMASLRCDAGTAERLAAGTGAGIAGYNAPRRTVVSGPSEAVAEVERRARAEGVEATRLSVSHAFHSPLVEGAAPALRRALLETAISPGRSGRVVVSSVTGEPLAAEAPVGELLVRQLTAPVRFLQALASVPEGVDLWIEVGPGRGLSALADECGAAPAVALDAGGASLAGLLSAAGAAFVLGAPVAVEELFRDRALRPPAWRGRPADERRFLANPCEEAPQSPAARVEPQPAAEPPAEAARDRIGGAALPALDLVRRMVAARAELPERTVADGDRMLSDLHLNSIAVGQLVAEAARELGASAPAALTDYADASVREVAAALEELVRLGGSDGEPEAFPPGVADWVRPFAVHWAERPLGAGRSGRPRAALTLFAPEGDPLAEALDARGEAPAGGEPRRAIVACLPAEPDPAALGLLLRAGRAAVADRDAVFVLVHRGWGPAFARTLHLERGTGATVVVGLPAAPSSAEREVAIVRDELAAAFAAGSGWSECRHDSAGARAVPVLRPLPEADDVPAPLAAPGRGDVVLISGGGRGIAAECGLALARETGAVLALVGRSRPEESPELAANLDRLTAAGVRHAYRSADVTDADGLARAVAELEAELGPVTALLHGAGVNRPRLIPALGEDDLASTLAPKLYGLRNILASVDPDRLRLLLAFGSIIAETGLAGEADYALANELLAREVERFAARYPRCRCLSAAWSVWSGVGMGERLGKVESLIRQGIAPIAPERAIAVLRELLSRPETPVTAVVTGRFGDPPTLGLDRREIPFLRFLERPRVHVPGVELVVDAELTVESDPYLADHVYDGERLFPAVLGLEAMAQAATALIGEAGPFELRDVRFDRPVTVRSDGSVTLRIAALARPGREGVDVVVRSSETGFGIDHFRARCSTRPAEPADDAAPGGADDPRLALDPGSELYGSLLFHRGRFRRLHAYRHLSATECAAEITSDGAVPWFVRYLPAALLLGDPGARDAAIHAVQACVPHVTVLPTGVERVVAGRLDPAAAHTVEARERSRDGRSFVFDLVTRDAAGRVVERWEGLSLRAVDDRPVPGEWPLALLAPYVERRIPELVAGAALTVGVTPEPPGARRVRGGSDGALAAVARNGGGGAAAARVVRRPDGRPELAGGKGDGRSLSAAHAAGLVLAVAGSGPVGCDAEPVVARAPAIWRDLLGAEGSALAELVARTTGEDADSASTRIWTAAEALKKAGFPPGAPLVLERRSEDGWVVLRSGRFAALSWIARPRGAAAPLAFAFLTGAAS